MIRTIQNAKDSSLQQFVEKAKDGLYMEFGVHTGGTIKQIAQFTTNKVYGFDSFEGLPEDWPGMHGKGHFACDIPEDLPDNVELVVGLFQNTLPKFIKKHKKEKVAFIHIDCDLYSSTKCIFDNLKNNFQDGSVIAFDELIGYTGWEDHEYKAFNEFLEETKYRWECIGRFGLNQVGFEIYK